jgi:hypothetical protein
MQALKLFLASVGRRTPRLLQQLPTGRLHQQRHQHLLRLGRILPSDPETHANPSPRQATQSRRRLNLLGRLVRNGLQYGAPEVLLGGQQNHQRDIRLHRHLSLEWHRVRSRRHLRLHGKEMDDPNVLWMDNLANTRTVAHCDRPYVTILQTELRLQIQLLHQQQVRRHKQLGDSHFAHRRRQRRQETAKSDK